MGQVTVLTEPPNTPRVYALAMRSAPRRVTHVPPTLEIRRYELPGQRVEIDRLAAYDAVCGFDLTGDLAPTYLHVLTMPLQLALMTSPDFPLPLLGLVHVRNEFTRYRPVDSTQTLELAAWADGLAAHAKGVTVDLHGEVRTGGELVWAGRSRYLARGVRLDGDVMPAAPSAPTEPTQAEPRTVSMPSVSVPSVAPVPAGVWQLPSDLGRRYAAVSGDFNPIHLSALTARAFGFPRAIAHGMWTHARSIAAVAPSLPDVYDASVDFRRPVPLPSAVAVYVNHRNAIGEPRVVELRLPEAGERYALRTVITPR